ncbi:hypothetical protein [Streptomyces sp. NPDC093093]|uniref:hypothetical protein n=1 Tax=Streptomyces sp. NPDC093093 TaxID=3366025 RepID=UPI003803EC90
MPDTAVEKWQHPDGHWTPEMTAMVEECLAGTRTTIPCPACGEESGAASVDTIYPEVHVPGRDVVRYMEIGRLVTLDPCGCAIKRRPGV